MIRDATLSPCGQFRFSLLRQWGASLPRLLFVMLNPSTADALADDRTVEKCIRFATRLGFGSIEIVNLFAYRTKNPIMLKRAGYPVGEGNDQHIVEAVSRAAMVICAWGANARAHDRAAEVLALIEPWCEPMALRTLADGVPEHPLYLPGGLVPQTLICGAPSLHQPDQLLDEGLAQHAVLGGVA